MSWTAAEQPTALNPSLDFIYSGHLSSVAPLLGLHTQPLSSADSCPTLNPKSDWPNKPFPNSASFSSVESAVNQRLLPATGYQARPGQNNGRPTHATTNTESTESYKQATSGGPRQSLYAGPEDDDDLHDWKKESRSHALSSRGILNALTLLLLVVGLVALFAGYPIISHFEKLYDASNKGGFNLGGTNGSGQVPDLPLFTLVDPDTPPSALTRTSAADGASYHLVFSDEFQKEGRTFWPGDDPFWEAVDLYYGATGDYEYYSPEAVNTTSGALTITMTQKITHNLNFQSGMVQSWNKFCFQGGYIEFSMKMPGSPSTSGYWPGLWLVGNLARPGYAGSTDGMWPYSYASCDAGILRNQTWINGTGPEGAIRSTGTYSVGGQVSFLSGMRSPACTCPGEDHPGPDVTLARSSPELDILEAQIQNHQGVSHGYASQSYQIAPFDLSYEWVNTSAAVKIWDDDVTQVNTYKGNVYQEAVSSLTQIPDVGYVDSSDQYVTYGVEYHPDWNEDGSGSITWYVGGKPSWSVNEPMTIIMNLGMAPTFQRVDFGTGGITFPATMSVDYVRVYQLDGQTDRISCDPPDHPTAKYIQNHMDLYTNPNYTVYPHKWPKNKLTGC
ncbi:related to SKN1-protein involved in sphingolipid biosynthesis [Ustilago bromivora]|uniref:Related to SKN1 - protein involved in sphingolipid biosynthesis n=1 Tax=Ustilago bromivora TaxID=307758 RepID=A0A1K0GYE8_9BASI|nr:related to SKN1-protein involved in sphingolipid biosynthesis [Ustilago bromivora]SYW78425.1 related to SKN1 - protein involved in sphingolipid biosynthesis [Ustilago bromivora]